MFVPPLWPASSEYNKTPHLLGHFQVANRAKEQTGRQLKGCNDGLDSRQRCKVPGQHESSSHQAWQSHESDSEKSHPPRLQGSYVWVLGIFSSFMVCIMMYHVYLLSPMSNLIDFSSINYAYYTILHITYVNKHQKYTCIFQRHKNFRPFAQNQCQQLKTKTTYPRCGTCPTQVIGRHLPSWKTLSVESTFWMVIICTMVKSRYIGDGHPTFNDGILISWGPINPYYWVEFPIRYYREIMGV